MTLREHNERKLRIVEKEAKRLYPDNEEAQKAYIDGADFGYCKLYNLVREDEEKRELEELKQKYSDCTLEDLNENISRLENESMHSYNTTTHMVNDRIIEEIRTVIRNKWYKQ